MKCERCNAVLGLNGVDCGLYRTRDCVARLLCVPCMEKDADIQAQQKAYRELKEKTDRELAWLKSLRYQPPRPFPIAQALAWVFVMAVLTGLAMVVVYRIFK